MDYQIIGHNSKTALSSTSKLGDFLFYPLDTFWRNFNKIDTPVAAVVFKMRHLEKLNMLNLLVHFKSMEMQSGV